MRFDASGVNEAKGREWVVNGYQAPRQANSFFSADSGTGLGSRTEGAIIGFRPGTAPNLQQMLS